MAEQVKVEYVADPAVDADLDWQLRVLLAKCFSLPRFRTQRYNHEVPLHRWFIRDANGRVVAHTAIHDKTLGSAQGELRIGGVAEVCVHPDFRGRQYVTKLLDPAHAWMREQGIAFSLLFGNPKVYGSNGYVRVNNPLRYLEEDGKQWVTKTADCALVKPLGSKAWPDGVIDLRCAWF